MRWAVRSLSVTKGTTLEVFLNGLSDDAEAEAEALLEALETHGNNLRGPISKPLGNGLFEARGLTTGVRLQKDAERALHRQERTRTLNKRP